jgi:hypothetical protein
VRLDFDKLCGVRLVPQEVKQLSEVLVCAVIRGGAGGHLDDVAQEVQAVDCKRGVPMLALARAAKRNELRPVGGLRAWERVADQRLEPNVIRLDVLGPADSPAAASTPGGVGAVGVDEGLGLGLAQHGSWPRQQLRTQ